MSFPEMLGHGRWMSSQTSLLVREHKHVCICLALCPGCNFTYMTECSQCASIQHCPRYLQEGEP